MTGDASAGSGGSPARRRNASATREAILTSAMAAFSRAGYDGAGVRDIAGAAGVTAMLVNRYFGSKERLFVEVVDRAFARRTVVGGDPATLGDRLAAMLVARTGPEAEDPDPFLLMLRSAANPRAAEIIRAGVRDHVGRHLADLLPGPDAAQRAELLLSLVAGVRLMREVINTDGLNGAEPVALTRHLRDLVQAIATPPADPPGGPAAGDDVIGDEVIGDARDVRNLR